MVTDATGITKGIPNVNLVLTLSPPDPIASSLTAKTDAQGNFVLSFNVVKGVVYQATLTTTSSAEFQEAQVTFKLDPTETANLVQNIQLKRVMITAKLQSTLMNTDK